jgi:hypothetical protein
VRGPFSIPLEMYPRRVPKVRSPKAWMIWHNPLVFWHYAVVLVMLPGTWLIATTLDLLQLTGEISRYGRGR